MKTDAKMNRNIKVNCFISFLILFISLNGCNESKKCEGKISFTKLDEVRSLNLANSLETVILLDTNTASLRKIIRLNNEVIVYESLNLNNYQSTIKMFSYKTQSYTDLYVGENPILISENNFMFFKEGKNEYNLFLCSNFVAQKIYGFKKPIDIYSFVKINDNEIVFLNDKNRLMKLDIQSKSIEETPFKNYYPEFFDNARKLLYANDLDRKELCSINLSKDLINKYNIYSDLYILDEINNCVYYREGGFSFYPKLGETSSLRLLDLQTKTDFLVKRDIARFVYGFLEN